MQHKLFAWRTKVGDVPHSAVTAGAARCHGGAAVEERNAATVKLLHVIANVLEEERVINQFEAIALHDLIDHRSAAAR